MPKVKNRYGLQWSDIPEDLAFLQEFMSLEVFLAMVDYCGGDSIYIPMRATLEQPLKYKYICREFNGHNCRELASKHKLCERQIRRIVKNAGLT